VSRKGKYKNNLYYLLPGMGRGARRRYWRNIAIGIFVSCLVMGLMALLIWYTQVR
jgi:hypothetical protein